MPQRFRCLRCSGTYPLPPQLPHHELHCTPLPLLLLTNCIHKVGVEDLKAESGNTINSNINILPSTIII